MSKTAMQELIHDFKYGKFNGLTNTQIDKLLEKYLKKEMEQIIQSNIAGMEFIPVDPSMYQKDAKDYYNKTYGGIK
jgi:hypothetical protein